MRNILMIEDDSIVASIYKNKFKTEGYHVLLAADGETGLQMVATEHPALVVVDLMLPRMNGVEVIRKIRSSPASKETPIIVFSNSYVTSLIQAAWDAGADNCLTKATCTPKQLLDVVERTLSKPASSQGGGAANFTPVASLAAGPLETAAAPAPVSRLNVPVLSGLRSANRSEADEAFQTDLRQSFMSTAPAALAGCRTQFSLFSKAEGEPEKVQRLLELYRRIHSLTSNAAITGLSRIAQMSAALEALVKELGDKPASINASTTRTLAHSIDLLAMLLEHAHHLEASPNAPSILVVDDELISRRAVIYALEKAGLKCVSVEEPTVAHNMLEENQFDLVFLDVDMPGMDGFELCKKLRAMPQHAKTPVVFVTAMSAFENRAKSMLSGGNDFIGKPFLFVELAVKALTFLMKGQLPAAQP